jgi:uncharacterized protein YecE (DUF72 family)
MIRVGTSGYSYDDWHGPFYPADLPAGERFDWYARFFNAVEINSTFYRQPTVALAESLARRAPSGFKFAVKAYGGLTHDYQAATNADFRRFREGLEPFISTARLGVVLAQFPGSFRLRPDTADYLRRLRGAWPDVPLAVEFRHHRWADPRVLALLRELKIGFCNVDEPSLPGLMAPSAELTAPSAYVRFHGRNAARWHEHEEAWERYDYTYAGEALAEWVPRIKDLGARADDVYVFFNNHYVAQAVTNARELMEMLEPDAAPQEGAGREPETVDVHR